MAKQACISDDDSKTVDKTVFIATSLQTHLAVMVSCADTVSELKNKIQYEHPLCFPNVGKIKIEAIKVKFRGHFYHLSQSVILRIAFDGFGKKSWFAYADVSVLPHDAPTHHFLLPDSNVKNTLVSHPPHDHPTILSNFDKGVTSSTYDHDQILLDISSPEKQGRRVMDYEVPCVGTRSGADESGRGMNDLQLKVFVEETPNVVSLAKKKRKIKHIENSSGNLSKEILQLNTSSTPDASRETVADDNDIKKEALNAENTHNVDGDVEGHPHAKPINIGEQVGGSEDENNIVDHCQEVETYNDSRAEEGNKTAQKQDSKSIQSESIKPSDEYDSDVRMNQIYSFSKNSGTNVTVEPKKSSGRRKKKKTEDPSGAMLDGTVETVADNNDNKKEALSGENTHNLDGDVEGHSHAKPINIGEQVGASEDENNILDHCQEVETYNDSRAEEGNKIAQKQDSKSTQSESIKPSDEYDSDVRMNRTSSFSKNSATNVTVEPKKSSGRRKKKTEDSSGVMLDGTVEVCMSKGEDVLAEFGNLGDLGQSSKIGNEQKENFPESQEENVIRRQVNPAKDKGKDAANQKGHVYEKDGGLHQFSEAQETVENKGKKKKKKRSRCSESKIQDNLRKDGRIGDNSVEGHHNRSLVEASKSKTIVGENRSHTVQASKPKMDQKLEASTKLSCNHERLNHQFVLDKLKPFNKAFARVSSLNLTAQKRSLLASSGPIFKDDSSESLEDEDQSYHSNWTTRTPSENSLSSAYSDGESNADSLVGKGQENGESLARADLSDKKAMTIENVLRSSKRYKKAKLIASQMEDTEKEPPGFILDSQADS